MTSTAKAASNGGKDTAATPERMTGVNRVQEAEIYHLASVAHDAAFEAERLCNDIYRAASDARFGDSPGSTAVGVTADPAMIGKAEDAVICLATAVLYLTDLFYSNLPA
jgi:hypothetical protein